MTDDAWLTAFPPKPLLGEERFTGLEKKLTVLDF